MKKLIRRGSAATITVLVGLGVTVAFAAWTTNGTGDGSARAQSAQALTTVDVSATTPATLYPGATGDLRLRIDNPNPYPVRVTAVSGNGSITSDTGAACNASTGVSFTNQSGLTLDVAPGSQATFTLAGSVAMSNSSHTSCQGAVFTVPVTLSGASNA
jgi:hypothetical protein